MQGGSRGLFETLGLLLNQYEYQWKELLSYTCQCLRGIQCYSPLVYGEAFESLSKTEITRSTFGVNLECHKEGHALTNSSNSSFEKPVLHLPKKTRTGPYYIFGLNMRLREAIKFHV